MKYKFLILSFLMFLISCTPVARQNLANLIIAPTYQEPAGKNITYFNLMPIENKKISRVSLVFYRNSYDCSGIAEVSNSWIKDRNRSPIKISANKKVAFGISYFPEPLTYCYFIAAFAPVAKQTYSVFIDAQDHTCHLAMSENSRGKLIPVKLQMREENTPNFQNGPHCKPVN